jgi:hypothetical protein
VSGDHTRSATLTSRPADSSAASGSAIIHAPPRRRGPMSPCYCRTRGSAAAMFVAGPGNAEHTLVANSEPIGATQGPSGSPCMWQDWNRQNHSATPSVVCGNCSRGWTTAGSAPPMPLVGGAARSV